jgi:glycosyltransferase involved in cell wall biosynthesis
MPSVSIVLPVYNGSATIASAIHSIRRQTLKDWEMIVVDDGSTDATIEIVQTVACSEPRMRVFTEPHHGIVSALNLALAEARAPLLARMDADDEAHADRLAEQVALLEREPQTGLVGSLVEFGGDRARVGGYALHVDWINSVLSPDDISIQRFVESPFAHPSVMFRRELVERYGGYREGDFPEDYELWLRWLDAGVPMTKVPRVLLRWQDRAGRLSRQDPRYSVDAFYRCKAVYLARWLRRHLDPARQLFIWGAGRPTRRRADHLLGQGSLISGYIDIDPLKIGRSFQGHPVLAPIDIPPATECFVLGYVAKRGARDLARAHLQSRGFVEGRDFLMAA